MNSEGESDDSYELESGARVEQHDIRKIEQLGVLLAISSVKNSQDGAHDREDAYSCEERELLEGADPRYQHERQGEAIHRRGVGQREQLLRYLVPARL